MANLNAFILYYLSQHCHDIPGLTIKRLYFELTGAVIYSHPNYAQLYENIHKNIHQSKSKSNLFKQNNKTNINNHKKSINLSNKFVTVDETNFPQPYTSHKHRKNHLNSTVMTTTTTITTKMLKQSTETVTNRNQLENNLDHKYPVNFSCEIYVHSRVNSRIMIRFQSFYIPSQQHLLCDENYLYLFDSNTPQYRAMAEAGGERGLCQHHFPTQPIFTTKSFVTIVFRSTTFSSSSSMDMEPGFKLILTAISDELPIMKIIPLIRLLHFNCCYLNLRLFSHIVLFNINIYHNKLSLFQLTFLQAKSTGVCENNEFFCGHISVEPSQLSYMHRNKRLITNIINSSDKTNYSTDIQPITTKHILQDIVQNNLSKVKSVKLKQRRSSKRKNYGYCISRLLQCDSIVHCHNARDELPSLRMNPSDLPHQLLHALVGAYLTPADLNNVGCTVYKLNNDPLINNNNKYTLVKSLFPSSQMEGQMFTNCSQTLFHTSLYSNINNSQTQMLNADIVPYNNLWRSASFGNETELLQPINNEFQTNIPHSITTTFLPLHQHPLHYHHQYSTTTAPPPPPPYPKDHRLINSCTASKQIKYHLGELGKSDEYVVRSPSKLLLKKTVGKEQNTKIITNFNMKTGTKRGDNRKLYRRKHKEHLGVVNNHLTLDHYTKNDRNRHYILSVYSDGSVSESSGMYTVKHCGYRNKKHSKHFDSKAQIIDSDSPATTDVSITHTSKRSRKCFNEHFMHTEHIQRVSHSHKHKTCHFHSKTRPEKHTDLLNNKIQSLSGSLCSTANNDTKCDKRVRDFEKKFDAKIYTVPSLNERYTISHSESNPLNLSFLARENTTNNMNRSFSSSDIPYTRHGEYI
ncbi:uncharacterized protein DC041_0006910 [Schistosoma bovis]|uniref:CUB domain-containing protein n=1 Tax=Schistosoma bovis TaxID=6184 RepID=A0A430Q8Y2_SCHBO|nr:uncharacterized protein DC041_0006910 [Schistosoma bovis]